ncbi:iron-sulfur cluster assembly scaffold protein [Candidatus Micrarchaeota archaeon]|nr:iron-sulfur cluster assembly scaffold protein [Candidatus Micrarchaeota archaeon]
MEEIYQQFIIDLYKNPLNFGKMEEPTYRAELGNATCGDSIELFIKIDSNGKVSESKFIGKGCAISQASASLFTGYLKGKSVEQLNIITKDDCLALLKINLDKNPSRMRCALLVFDTFKKAVDQKS